MVNDIHVMTQDYENYGDATRPYWKPKGGSIIVLTGFAVPADPSQIDAAVEAVVNAHRDTIEIHNDYCESDIIGWKMVPAGTLTEDEQMQMEYDGRVDVPSQRVAL